MAHAVKRVPDDFHSITPHLVVRGVDAAVVFYAQAFGASELFRNLSPDGTSVMHCEVLLGDSRFFVVDEMLQWGVKSPLAIGDTAVTFHLYVEDADAAFARAVAAGAEPVMPVQDQFWGERYGMLKDPFGHRWSVSHRLEDLSPRQVHERAQDWVSNLPKKAEQP